MVVDTSKRILLIEEHSLLEVEEIQAIEKEESEEEYEENDHTLVALDVGDFLVIRRVLHAKEVPFKPRQKE